MKIEKSLQISSRLKLSLSVRLLLFSQFTIGSEMHGYDVLLMNSNRFSFSLSPKLSELKFSKAFPKHHNAPMSDNWPTGRN